MDGVPRRGRAPGLLDGCPTAQHEALPNLNTATTRRSALDGSYPANCLEEHERGRIAPGLAADFAVLDRDPFTEGAEVLLEARVVRTVVAGHPVYEAVEASVA